MELRILRVDMTTATVTEEPFNQKDYGYYGGRGLIDVILSKEGNPTCDPLGPDNLLIFATGLLAGTNMTTSGRLSVGGKSPLTGGIKESNSGGTMARTLIDQAIKMVIVKGKAPEGKLYYLYVSPEGKASLECADEIAMKGNYELGDILRAKYNDEIAIASVGPAAERGALTSSVMVTEFKTHHPCRAAARGGMGTVMASKGLKAVVVEEPVEAYKPVIPEEYKEEFQDCVRRVAKSITDNPMTRETYPNLGSAAGVDVTGMMGGLPYKNFSGKRCEYQNLASPGWTGVMKAQGGHGGMPCQKGCIIRCTNEFVGKDGKYLSGGIEYETLALCGSNLGIFDPNFVATVDRFCDDYGLDTIDTGAAIGVAMDCGVLEFGDQEAALKLLYSVQDENSELGKVLLKGCQAMGEHLGAKRIPTSKRQALAAYDPRVIPGFGRTFERSPMGGDHTSGSAMLNRTDLSPDDQVDAMQALTAACDNYVCLFAWGSISMNPDGKAALARAVGIFCGDAEGPGIDPDFFEALGRKMLYFEHSFNKANGWTFEDEKVPDFFYNEPAEANGKVFERLITRSFLDIADERGMNQPLL